MKKLTILWSCLAVVLAACSGDDDSTSQGVKEFPQDTEWVGVLDRSGYQFAPPAYLQFKENDKLVLYAPHFFVEDGTFIDPDSVNGSITSTTQVDGATIEVKANIEHYGEVTMTIKDKRTMTSISTNANKPVPFTLELYDTPLASLSGSIWSGPVMTSPAPVAGMLAYPDLSTIVFDQTDSYYGRGGHLFEMTPQTPGNLAKSSFKKDRAMVRMKGFNETNAYLIDYFGVLLPGNDRMMVFSDMIGARLPYYTQTIPWNGPIGQTPIIERQ